MTNTIPQEPLAVLLVEDNPADARIIAISLQELPLKTHLTLVHDGEDALTFLRRQAPYTDAPRPDIMLLDLHMPRKNGFEVLDEVYADPHLREIPVVVCLGSAFDADLIARFPLAPDCIFAKGYDPERLLQVLTRCPGTTRTTAPGAPRTRQ